MLLFVLVRIFLWTFAVCLCILDGIRSDEAIEGQDGRELGEAHVGLSHSDPIEAGRECAGGKRGDTILQMKGKKKAGEG